MGLLLPLSAVAAAFILLTIAQTREAYPELPERVPTHLDFAGRPNGYGPRPMIWLLVGVQIFCAIIFVLVAYALAARLPGTHGSLPGLALMAPLIMAMLWRAQRLLLEAARAPDRRVRMGPFWLFYITGLTAIIAIIVFVR